METLCPHCRTPAEADALFCTECGGRLVPSERLPGRAGAVPPAESPAFAPPPAPFADPAEHGAPGPSGGELVVEVEVNRPMVHGHALLLRFRATSNLRPGCDVTMRMKLHGQGRYIEQAADEREYRCRLSGRGEQFLFSFPFHSLRPGDVFIQELRVTLHPRGPGRPPVRYELPDQSLHVHIADPALEARGPGIAISGGIHLDLSQLKEMYGSDIKSLLHLNAPEEGGSGQLEIAWQPIRLRVVPDAPLGDELRLTLPGGVPLELVRIRPGAFLMGSPEGQGKDDEHPAHRVRIMREFLLGKFPVTQEQYEALLGENPSRFPASPQHPVDHVSWDDSREFCRRLLAHLTHPGDAPGEIHLDAVGLPTEAEWEYACRAGTQTLFSFGDDPGELPSYGWFDRNSGRTTHPVGQCKPNAWGLYDMHGNVWEWCEDRYADDYSRASEVDPPGPATGDRRVLRGGSWSYFARQCRSASRHAAPPASRTANYGFRIALRTTMRDPRS